MIRFAPGFPIHKLVVGGSGCTISIENSGGDQHKVTVAPLDTILVKYGKTEIEALEAAAAELDRAAQSVRNLADAIKKGAS